MGIFHWRCQSALISLKKLNTLYEIIKCIKILPIKRIGEILYRINFKNIFSQISINKNILFRTVEIKIPHSFCLIIAKLMDALIFLESETEVMSKWINNIRIFSSHCSCVNCEYIRREEINGEQSHNFEKARNDVSNIEYLCPGKTAHLRRTSDPFRTIAS